MPDKDLGDGDGPSLEMPSLGSLFKRKKKPVEQDDAPTVTRDELDAVVRGERPAAHKAAPGDDAVPEASSEADAEATEVEAEAGATEAETTDADDASDVEPDSASDSEPTAVVPVVDAEPDAEPTAVIPPVTTTATEATAATETAVSSEPEATASSADQAQTDAEADRPLFADEVDGQTDPTDGAAGTAEVADLEETDEDDEAEQDDEADSDGATDRRRPRPSFTLPVLPGRAAAAITGLVVGVLAVALTYLAVQGCEKAKGTSTCGTPGFFLLIAIMILLVVLGSSLLKAWQVGDPGSTSFLAVGLMAVVALLFLIRVIYSPWMALVIPLVTVVTFVVSHWLTSLFVDEETAT